MAKTIIEYRGKRYQVVRLKEVDLSDVCKGCALEGERYGCECPCVDFDDSSKFHHILHILKEIKNGTK